MQRWAVVAVVIALGLFLFWVLGLAPARDRELPPVEYITSEVTEELGLPFSEAVRAGDWVVLSGMIGNRPGTLELEPGGIEPETRRTLHNIATILGAAGVSRDEVVKCTVMLDDIGDWPRFNEIYTEFFGDHRPARSAFGADGLALGAAVELECLAFAPQR